MNRQSLVATSPAPQLPKSVIFTTSGIGGCLGWVIVHPVNTLAVRWNLASMQGKKFSVGGMVKQSGLMSLYDGLGAGVMRQVFYATARFGLFETFRDKLHEIRGKTDFPARVVLGAISGGIAAYISCPFEVATVRNANDSSLPENKRRNYKGLGDTMTRIVKEEGVAAFWSGSTPFVQRAMLVGIFQVATMDQFKQIYANALNQKKNSIPNVFCASFTAGFIYSVMTMPLEASKNRMASQTPDPVSGKMPYTSTLQTIRAVSAKEGFLALYNGFFPYYLRCGGHTVSMFIIIQLLRENLPESLKC